MVLCRSSHWESEAREGKGKVRENRRRWKNMAGRRRRRR